MSFNRRDGLHTAFFTMFCHIIGAAGIISGAKNETKMHALFRNGVCSVAKCWES